MKPKASKKDLSRRKKKLRVRKKILGSAERPRLSVFRSGKYTYAQIVSDDSGSVIAASSTRSVIADSKSAKSKESAKALGEKIAELAKEKNISQVVFDRNGYIYHGRVAAVAEGAREKGLVF